jgi:hypothetical protein
LCICHDHCVNDYMNEFQTLVAHLNMRDVEISLVFKYKSTLHSYINLSLESLIVNFKDTRDAHRFAMKFE